MHRSQVFKDLGSFWYSVFSDQDTVRKMASLSRQTRAPLAVQSVIHNLAGNHEVGRRINLVNIDFNHHDVIETGTQLYDPEPEFNYTSEFGRGTVYGKYRVKYFALPMGRYRPFSILYDGGKLLLGIDFFIDDDRYLFFRQDPRKLFRSSYLIEIGEDRGYRPVLSFLTKSFSHDFQDLLVQYYRAHQTPEYYKLALAATGGLQILREEQKLLEIIPHGPNTIYVFETETRTVDYEHDLLEVGVIYPKHFIIGNGIEVFQNDHSGRAWWRQVDWRGGLSLEPVLNFRGLSLVDRETVVYNAGQEARSRNGNKVHARIRLSENFYQEKPYWDAVEERETSSNIYLNALTGLAEESDGGDPTVMDTFQKMLDAYTEANELNQRIGLPSESPDVGALPNSKLINALDAFFNAVLGIRAFIIVLRPSRIKFNKSLLDFIRRESLLGCTPIVFSYGPDFIERVKLIANISGSATVTIQDIDPLELEEVINLQNMEKDYAVTRDERPL